MIKKVIPFLLAIGLAGCASQAEEKLHPELYNAPKVYNKPLKRVPDPSRGQATVAVYSFKDLTGQRKNSDKIASLSAAVTQGAETLLIRSLQKLNNGKWFRVIERVNLDQLIKERQIIRSVNQDNNPNYKMPPLMYAGAMISGGIVGYDSNTTSGGIGARVYGIGAGRELRKDTVVVSLRITSVTSGEILASVLVTKTIYSVVDSASVVKFLKPTTNPLAIEFEAGVSVNESTTIAIQKAIDAAVVELIYEGKRKNIWSFKKGK